MTTGLVDQFEPWLDFVHQAWERSVIEVSDLDLIRTLPGMIMIFGCGDSHCAALGMEMLLGKATGAKVMALHSMQAGRYLLPGLILDPAPILAIGISASGEVARTIEAMEIAKELGANTLALTCNPSSALARTAERTLSLEIPQLELGPGMPSYSAALIMLAALAFAFLPSPEQDNLAAAMHAFEPAFLDWAPPQVQLAEQAAHESRGTGTVFVGSGPAFGSAAFGAAKLIEAAGEPAWRQDVEEWCHLEYFCGKSEMPTWLLSSGGRSGTREEEMMAAARVIGRQLILSRWQGWSQPGTELAEMLSPLALWVGPAAFALTRAQIIGETPFRAFGGGRSRQEGGGVSKIRSSTRLGLADIQRES